MENSIFNITSVMVLVEYLYKNARNLMIYRRFPVFVVLIFIFYLDAHLREIETEGQEDKQHAASIVFFIINILITVFELYNIGMQIKLQKAMFFQNTWGPISLTLYFGNLLSSILYQAGIETIFTYRDMNAILSVLFWIKFLQFLTIFDEFAPLLSIVFKIVYGCRIFSILFLICIFAYSNAFYFLGRDQIEFDEVDKADYPGYSQNILLAMNHVFNIALGQFNTGDYSVGKDPKQENILWVCYLTAIFIMMLTLLNMLIAIMGDIFARSYES